MSYTIAWKGIGKVDSKGVQVIPPTGLSGVLHTLVFGRKETAEKKAVLLNNAHPDCTHWVIPTKKEVV